MERLNVVNEDPRFQSYMSAAEDDRKMLNTYKDKAEKALKKGFEQGLEQGRSNTIKDIAKVLNISEKELTQKLKK